MFDEGFPDSQTKVEQDIERHLLGTTVRLSDGSEGLVFSRGAKNESHMFLYNCHLCGVPNLPGERCLQTHISGRKHQIKLTQSTIDAELFRAPLLHKAKIQMDIAPGEPVPPGFENEVKAMAEIQPCLDKYKETALVGLEYIIELIPNEDKEPGYICLLCDKRGDPRTILAHLTSYNHRLKYLEKHFASAIKELTPYRYNTNARNIMPNIIQTLCEAIEDFHGRLTPTVYANADFNKSRKKVLQEIINDKHFDEKHGPTFVNVIDRKVIQEAIKSSKNSVLINVERMTKREVSPPNVQAPKRIKSDSSSLTRKTRESMDSFSSISSSSIGRHTPSRNRKTSRGRSRSRSNGRRVRTPRKSQSPVYRPRMSRSPPFGHKTEKKVSRENSEISNISQGYLWEKYRCLVDTAIKEQEKVLNDHEKNPEKHPLYPEEWKKFWNRRYKELQAEKKDPNKYDFKPEWIIFWTKRMKELHNDSIEIKKTEIRKKLGLSDCDEEKSKQLKQQKASKSIEKLPIIDISDSDESLSSHGNLTKRKKRSPKKSLSPISDITSKDKNSIREHDKYMQDKYKSDYYHAKTPAQWSRNYYGTPSHISRYSYRTMASYNYPQYEPEQKEDDGPLTVVSVLRLLTALEENLGSLGPKIIDLLAKALALEKISQNYGTSN